MNKSKCCGENFTVQGTGDFRDKDRAVTQYYECDKCKRPCDVVDQQPIEDWEEEFDDKFTYSDMSKLKTPKPEVQNGLLWDKGVKKFIKQISDKKDKEIEDWKDKLDILDTEYHDLLSSHDIELEEKDKKHIREYEKLILRSYAAKCFLEGYKLGMEEASTMSVGKAVGVLSALAKGETDNIYKSEMLVKFKNYLNAI